MPLPLIALGAMAAGGALKGIFAKKAANDAANNAWAQAEDQRKRQQSQWTLSELPQAHGAEQRKTIRDIMLRGMFGNWAGKTKSGSFADPGTAAMEADRWNYRDQNKLAALSPYAAPLAKPKTGGFGGYLMGGLGGALGGAAEYYGAGGTANPFAGFKKKALPLQNTNTAAFDLH